MPQMADCLVCHTQIDNPFTEADRLLDETAAWIWIGGRIPDDDGSPRRNAALLAALPGLAERLEG